MMQIMIVKMTMMVFSIIATFLSFVFMLSPPLFSKFEEFAALEFGDNVSFTTVLEGRINFLDDWLHKHRMFIGPLLIFLSGWNTLEVFFLFFQ